MSTVLATFNGLSAVYKPNYSHYCFRRCFFPYTTYINSAATAYINLAATAYINLAVNCYGPPYRGATRL